MLRGLGKSVSQGFSTVWKLLCRAVLCVLFARQLDVENRSVFTGFTQHERTSVPAHEVCCNGEAKSCAPFSHIALKGGKQVGPGLFGQTGASVFH